MAPTDWLTLGIIAAAMAAVFRGTDVRLALLAAALALGAVAGDLAPVVREFLTTFSNEKFVVPICASMGFAYVLKHTGCDRHLVRALVGPIRRVRPLMVPGVVGVGFLVNIPVISQTSTAVCLGTVVVPLMRAAGFSAATTGAALLLGASVGGELLNPGAPELLTVKDKTGVDTRAMVPRLLPLVLPMLGVSALVLWATEWWRGWKQPNLPSPSPEKEGEESTPSSSPSSKGEGFGHEPLNPLKALIPLVPLAILFASGPPLDWVAVSQRWVVPYPSSEASAGVAGVAGAEARERHRDPRTSSRMIGLAMLIGVAAAAAAAPRHAGGCMKAFFEGAGYGFTHIISLIVIASCFGKGIEQVGLARHLGNLIAAEPNLLHPLAGVIPWAFAFLSGSGMASTQSLYGFFYGPAVEHGQDPLGVGAMVSTGAAAGRTMSPVAAVTLMAAALTGAPAGELVKRVAPPLLIALAATIGLRLAGLV